MAKQKYIATNLIDNIGGKVVKTGDEVALEEEAASAFVAGGSLVPKDGQKDPSPAPG